MKHLIIGAGVNGLISAATFIENEIPVIIYEREKQIGGLWNVNNQCGLVNPESTVQVDPVIYRPLGDNRPVHYEDAWKGINAGPEEVLQICRDMVEKSKIDIVFGREVVKVLINEDKTIRVWSRDVESKQEREEDFAGLHVRTGSLNKSREVYFKGQDVFQGIISKSLRGDISVEKFQGKDVVIIGGGSFATEHTVRALKGGAKKITLIARTKRLFLSQYTSYLLNNLYSPDASDPIKVQKCWELSIEATKKLWKVTGMEEMGDTVLRKVNGHDQFVFPNGVCSLHADILLLGCYYGIVEFIEDEVDHLMENSVVTKSGREIHADYLIKSMGFYCDISLIKNYSLHDSYFVEGLANFTSSINIDRIVGTKLIGSEIPGSNIFLLSVFLGSSFDFVASYFYKNPEKFEKFKKIPTFSTIHSITNHDLVEVGKGFCKIFTSGENEIIHPLLGEMSDRQKMYDELLPKKKFLEYHKRVWEDIVKILADTTGKEKIPFPWENDLLV